METTSYQHRMLTARPTIDRAYVAVLGLLLGLASGCASADGDADSGSQDVVGGSPNVTYPEAATIAFSNGDISNLAFCTGSVVAPQVVLTAGHCVVGQTGWVVHVGNELRGTTQAKNFDFKFNAQGGVDPSTHDLALLFLDSPIQLAQYPTIARSRLPNNAPVTEVGRMNNGTLQFSTFTAPGNVSDGSARGFPNHYVAPLTLEHGDSGGPVFAANTHTIVAVNSAIASNFEVLARVDLLFDAIQNEIKAHGGAGSPPPSASSPITGKYGEVSLVSMTDGRISGALRKVDGNPDQGGAKCELTFSGSATGASLMSVAVEDGFTSSAGSLQATADFVGLEISTLNTACAQVFGSSMLRMSSFPRTGNGPIDTLGFRTVKSSKAFFLDKPGGARRAASCERGDTVEITGPSAGGSLPVRYTSVTGHVTTGFMAESDLVSSQ
jgi:V8-like Glu-specific endopeptidase